MCVRIKQQQQLQNVVWVILRAQNKDLCIGWIKRCSVNSAHCGTLTNIFSWNFCVNLYRDVTHRDQKVDIFSFYSLVRWSAFSPAVYNIQEMLHEYISFSRGRSSKGTGNLVHTPPSPSPKMHTPAAAVEAWQRATLPILFGCLKYKHFPPFPSPGHKPHPNLAGPKPMSSRLVSPYNYLQDAYR